MSKEMALFLPGQMFLTYDLLLPEHATQTRRRGPRVLLAQASLLVGRGCYAIVRLRCGIALFGGVKPSTLGEEPQLLPDRAVAPRARQRTRILLSHFRSGQPFRCWLIIVMAGYVSSSKKHAGSAMTGCLRTVFFAVVWVLAALAPAISITAERTTFLSSCGVALGLSAFSVYDVGSRPACRRLVRASHRSRVRALFMVVNDGQRDRSELVVGSSWPAVPKRACGAPGHGPTICHEC